MWIPDRAAAPVGQAAMPAFPARRLAPVLVLLLLAGAQVAAQPATPGDPGGDPGADALQLYAYTLQHKRAMEALGIVQPLLSRRGSVELRPAENTLVIRDNLAALSAMITALRRFDLPARPLTVEVMIIHARRSGFSPLVEDDDLPEPLVTRLRELLPFSIYRVLAKTELRTREGEKVTYELGSGFRVSFSSGTVVDGRRLRLHDFRVSRTNGDSEKALIHSNLSLRLGSPMALTLASAESSSTAFMVVLTPNLVTPERSSWQQR